MLTADLVRVQRRGDVLSVRPLQGPARQRALALAGAYVGLAAAHDQGPRGELEDALAAVEVEPRDLRLAEGLKKLVLDRCDFEAETPLDPVALRRELFREAAAARAATPDGATFERAAVLEAVATRLGRSPAELEDALFADLREAHRLRRFRRVSAEGLVEAYDRGQASAVLLRALRVRVSVYSGHPTAYRRLFHRLKFLRLLFRVDRQEDGGYRLEIDGPFSLFDGVTRYGVQLALLVPALDACDGWQLEADVLWGRDRRPCRFEAEGGREPGLLAGADDGDVDRVDEPLADDVASLLQRFRALDTGWEVLPQPEILDLPGVGLCVPDLRFRHRASGRVAYLEVLGFWSREAVWRRVDLVQAGLPYRVIFAVSERLRVSADVLDADAPGVLYVYKGVLSARRIAELLDSDTSR